MAIGRSAHLAKANPPSTAMTQSRSVAAEGPACYHWGALSVANAVYALSTVSHATRLAHLRGQIGVPRHADTCEEHISGDTFTLSWGLT
jgi:hypothetical protein